MGTARASCSAARAAERGTRSREEEEEEMEEEVGEELGRGRLPAPAAPPEEQAAVKARLWALAASSAATPGQRESLMSSACACASAKVAPLT